MPDLFVSGGVTLGTTTVAADGSWSLGVTAPLGSDTLSVTQSINGATSSASTVTVGIVPPAPSIATPANSANLPNGNNVVTGTATANSTVTVLDNGTAIGSATAAANGFYSVVVSLGYGTHVLTTTSSNAGGTSAASAAVTVNVAPGAPVITTPSSLSINNLGPYTIAGTAVPNATVTIVDNGSQVATVTAAANGSFTYTSPAVALGAHAITLTQTAGGLTSPSTPAYTITEQQDTDGDGLYDSIDNCPTVWNFDQVDRDGDHIGDVCDQAPNFVDSSNQHVSTTDIGVTSSITAQTSEVALNQNNTVLLPQGAWPTQSTMTIVQDPTNTGVISMQGKASPSNPSYSLLTTYDLRIGKTPHVALAAGLPAMVTVTTPSTTLSQYAFRYKTIIVNVTEANSSVTTIPNCVNGTVSASDNRCVSNSIAYQLVNGTNVEIGFNASFAMKAF
jgi:hypothetical protein